MKPNGLTYTGQLENAARFIHNHDHFLVIAHVQPDGDAIGSSFAMGWLLKSLNKAFTLVNEDRMPIKLQYLSSEFTLHDANKISSIPEHVISLDCADYSRLGSITERITSSSKILNIDHHATNDRYGSVQLINVKAAATAEIMYDLIEHMGIKWTSPMATAVYTGMLTDTGGFRYANTTPELLKKASHLLEFGVSANELCDRLLEKFSVQHIQLLKRSLQSLQLAYDHKISWMIVSEQDVTEAGASPEDLEGLVNYPRNIEGVDVGILFKQVNQSEVKVSFRSTEKVDVAQIASFFKGGGHKMAAGATINGSLHEVVEQVIEKVKQEME